MPSTLPYSRSYNQIQEIPYLVEPPSYQDFFNHHLLPNFPLLIGPSMTENWRARKEWVIDVENENQKITTFSSNPVDDLITPVSNHNSLALGAKVRPNFEYLRSQFGEALVCVADCSKKYFTDQARSKMLFKEFIDIWRKTSLEISNITAKDLSLPIKPFLYCKDWHFAQTFPEYYAYETPEIFQDDWMNEFWIAHTNDDYRFVYMGGHGTFTPFHCDVYRSYSWSANICGIKKWTLFPPDQEHLLRDPLGNIVYDLRDVDSKMFPNFAQARRFVVYQHTGETLFVPSSWYHMVENIGDCISINHNWAQSTAFDIMYVGMKADLLEVKYAIRDLQDEMAKFEFIETCQRLLMANAGWDWVILWQLINCISSRFLRELDILNMASKENCLHITPSIEQRHENKQEWKVPPLALQPPIDFILRVLCDVIHDFLEQTHAIEFLLRKYAPKNEVEVLGVVKVINQAHEMLKK
ncbi:hypothetical protein G9A89_022911 [Geosiphon pyriformis]|nr:hypothetical protein G9A89_022911 [Geosiphon pyriformis]